MQYSPKLKKAIAQIRKIIEENDLAGFACIVEPGFSEYIHVINPSFSVANFDGLGKVRIKTTDLPILPSEKQELLCKTSNMLVLLATTVMEQGMNLGRVSKFIDNKIGAEHSDGHHTSQQEIDN